MKTIFLTDKGQVRYHNEDAGGIYINQTQQPMAIVADGMGGHKAGDVASHTAVNIIQESWNVKGPFEFPCDIETWLGEIIQTANRAIYDKAQQNQAYTGMGTTIVIAVCTYECVTFAHIGDSRGYVLNQHGFAQMTQDHSLVNELLRTGELSEDDAHNHPQKNIVLKALGTQSDVTPDIKTINWDMGDKLLLCSDGLTDKVSESELEQTLTQSSDIDSSGRELLNLANSRGGEDNISLAIVLNDTDVHKGEAS